MMHSSETGDGAPVYSLPPVLDLKAEKDCKAEARWWWWWSLCQHLSKCLLVHICPLAMLPINAKANLGTHKLMLCQF